MKVFEIEARVWLQVSAEDAESATESVREKFEANDDFTDCEIEEVREIDDDAEEAA